MKYRLSNNQKKELLIRSQPLAIAIPAPRDVPEDPAELLQWARDAFEEGQYVTHAERDDVCVIPSGAADFSGMIGAIVNDDPPTFAWWVDCIICHLDPTTPPRHQRKKLQWPAAAVSRGRIWPKPLDAEPVPETAETGAG